MLLSAVFHKEFVPLRISTHEIGITGQKFSRTFSAEALSALIFEPKNELFSWKAVDSAEVHFYLERENDHTFKIEIDVELTLSCACVRCLSPVSMRIPIDFKIRMLQKERFAPAHDIDDIHFESEELEIDSDEDSLVGYFSDKSIDLGIILRDQIFLQVPDYPQCKNDGQGSETCRKNLSLLQQDDEDGQQKNPFVTLFSKKTK